MAYESYFTDTKAAPPSGGGYQSFFSLPTQKAPSAPQLNALRGGVPKAGDAEGLTTSLQRLQKYSPEDQVRIVNRASQAGLIDRNKASEFIKGSSIGAPVAPPKLNILQKGAVLAHEAAPSIARAIPNAFADIGESLRHQGAKQGSQAVSSTIQQLQKLSLQDRQTAIKNNPGIALILKNNGVNLNNPIDSELQKATKGTAQKAQKASSYTPGSKLEKTLLGSQPIQSYQQRASGYKQELQQRKVDIPFVHHQFTGAPGQALQAIASPLAAALGLAQVGGDVGTLAGAANADKIVQHVKNLTIGGAPQTIKQAKTAALIQKGRQANITDDLGRLTSSSEKIPEGQKALGTGQKKLSSVTTSAKASQSIPGGVFGKAATEPAKAAKVQTKTEAALNSIDERLAAIDRGEVTVTPQERKDLFQTRQVLSGASPATRIETQAKVGAMTELHANADVTQPSLEATISRAKSESPAPAKAPSISVPTSVRGATDTAGKGSYTHYTTPEAATNIRQEGFNISKSKSAQGDGVYLFNGDKPKGLTMGAGSEKLDVKLSSDTKLLDTRTAGYSGPSPTSGNKLKEYAIKNGYDGVTDGAQTVIYNKDKLITPGSKAPEFTKQVETTLNKVKPVGVASTPKGAVGELQSLLTPGRDTKTVQTDLRAATGNLALKTNQEARSANDTIKLFDRQKPGENLNFIQKVESGVKQSTPELDKVASNFRTQFNEDYELAKSLKEDLPFRDNYFAQSGIWEDPKAAEDFSKKFISPTLGGKPGALEQRQFPTIYDGVKAGLKLKETNPAIIALNNRTSLLKAKMAQDFLEEQAAKGVDKAVAQKVVDRYLEPGFQGSDIYKTAKGAAYALNSAQLGLSGFHVTGTALNATFSQFANGLNDILRLHPIKGTAEVAGSVTAPLKYILSGNKILNDVKAGNLTSDIKNIAEGGGRIGAQVDYRGTGLAKSLSDIRTGHVLKGVAAAPLRAMNDVAKPVMEWWVPRIKAGATKELIDRRLSQLGSDASPEAIRAAEAEAIDSIDNRFGQLTQDNLFWNQKVKDISKVLMRSPGWNIGTVREVGGGAKDLLMPSTYKALAKGQGLSERSAYTLSLAAGTAMIGTALSYMFTGKPPKDPIDYFYPKTGQTDKNGNAERVSLPTYAKDIFAFTHNPATTVSNKANPLIALGKDVASNKDYFGNQVRNPEDSLGTQAKQTLKFAGKNILPFSVTNANQRVDKSNSTKAQSFFGLTPAPGYITKSGFEQKVQGALNQALGTKPLTPEQQALVNSKSQAKQTAKAGDNSQIDALVKSGQLTDKQGNDLKASSKQTSLANQFAYLLKVDRPAAAKLISIAGPDDIKKLGDLNKLRDQLNKSQYNRNTKQSTKDASKTLLQVLNSKR